MTPIIIAVVALAGCFWYSPSTAKEGLLSGWAMLYGALPMMAAGFLIAGLATAVIPKDIVATYLGKNSGIGGLALASVFGAATPGITAVQFAIIMSLAKLGVGIGPIVAYFTGWCLLGISRLITYEIPFLGGRVALARFTISLVLPVGIGWLCQRVIPG